MLTRLPVALAALAAVSGCALTGEGAGGDQVVDAALGTAPTVDREARQRVAREDMLTQMAFWAAEYQTFPNDLEAAQRFAEALRRGGRVDRSVQIATEALGRFPQDRELLITYGYAQITSGRPHEALRPLALVAQAEPENWRVRSALGAALDQLGRFDEARAAYREALAIEPDNARVLTNLGVSYLMAGEPAEAERLLRQASAIEGAPREARHNLAISLALQGRFDEAERIERADLPPAIAAQNIAYLRGLLHDPRSWSELRRPG